MAPRARFERTTCGLEVRCSIQLSYRGPKRTYRTTIYHRDQSPAPSRDRSRLQTRIAAFGPWSNMGTVAHGRRKVKRQGPDAMTPNLSCG